MKFIHKLVHRFIGCPKRKICSIHQSDSETCTNGPYSYCGRYRSLQEPKIEN